MKQKIFIILILLVGVAIYSNSLFGEFHFDDYPGIVANAGVQNLQDFAIDLLPYKTWTRVLPFFTFALNYHFHGLHVFGYHLVNLIIHLINALLVFWLFRLAAQAPPLKNTQWFKRKEELALLAALIFVAHPVQVQAVSYIYQRLASMATLWYLLTMCFYFKGRIKKERRVQYFALSLFSALLGVFTKEIVFTLPVMVVMSEMILFAEDYDLKNLRQSISRERAVLIFLLILTIIVLSIPFSYRITPQRILTVSSLSHSHLGEMVNFKNYIPTQMRVIMTYIRLLFLPMHMRFDYDFAVSPTIFDPKAVLSAIAILSILIFAWRYRAKNPLVSFGIFWFFIALCVESIFPIRNVIWEYRVYLPMTGFCFFLTGISSQFLNQRHLMIVTIGLIGILGALTFQRNEIYRSEILLWKETVAYHPQKSRPYSMLGSVYINHGDLESAVPYLKKAIEMDPDHAAALFNLASSLAKLGRYAEAVPYALRAYKIDPDIAVNPSLLAYLYYQQGDYRAALDYYQKTLMMEGTDHLVESYLKVIHDFYDAHRDQQVVLDQIKFLESLKIFPKEVADLKTYIE